MGFIISVVNQKGGSGKSTTSIHLAAWLARHQDASVLLIDADAQKSSSLWTAGMDSDFSCRVFQEPDDILEQVPALAADYDFTVVDGPASLSEMTRAILFVADFALVPAQPTGIDLRSAGDAVRLIKQAQSVRRGPPLAAVFLSRAVKGTRLKDEARELLASIPELTVLDTVIHQKQAISDSSGRQATVWDLSGRAASDSAREYATLFAEVLALLPAPASV